MSDRELDPDDSEARLARADSFLQSLAGEASGGGEQGAGPMRELQPEVARAIRSIMMLMCEGAAILNAEGRLLHCNARLGQLLERPVEELVGQSFSSFVHPDHAAKWQSAFGARGGPPPLGFTLQVLVSDRRPMPVHVALCSLGKPLEPIAFLVASDLTWQEERMRQLERLNRELQRQRQALEVAATTDSTTGAYSSGAVFEVLETEIAYGGRYSYPVSALLMDIDHFKSLNDSYGHAFGDHVLREFCDRCREAIRGTDYLVRYGGDEFLVILPQTGQSGARAVARRILQSIHAERFGGGEHDVPVTVSVGAATALPQDAISAAELLKHADEALYRVKQAGRDGLASWRE